MQLEQTQENTTPSPTTSFLTDVLEGLSATPKTLSCKYFYDARGSDLFEQICELDAYYLTNTEIELMATISPEIAKILGPDMQCVELGSGASKKIQLLLEAADAPAFYQPLDISPSILEHALAILTKKFPTLDIRPLCFDYTNTDDFPPMFSESRGAKLIYFPGSTIGNFEPPYAREFLSKIARALTPNGYLLIGYDLLKDQTILEKAYDDPQGVTAQFNKNLLTRINKELEGTINVDQFVHKACLNQQKSRIEMHLVSERDQIFSVAGHQFSINKDETIHTENSYKYSQQAFIQLAKDSGFTLQKTWTDPKQWFAVSLLQVQADKR